MSKKLLSSPYNRPWRPIIWWTQALGARWEWVVKATPRRSTLRERAGTHFVGGWVGHRAGLNRWEKVHPHRDSLSGPSIIYWIAIPTTLSCPYLRNYRKICWKSAELILGWLIFGRHRTILIITTLQLFRTPRFWKIKLFSDPYFCRRRIQLCASYNQNLARNL
jgi:hypothetical protein